MRTGFPVQQWKYSIQGKALSQCITDFTFIYYYNSLIWSRALQFKDTSTQVIFYTLPHALSLCAGGCISALPALPLAAVAIGLTRAAPNHPPHPFAPPPATLDPQNRQPAVRAVVADNHHFAEPSPEAATQRVASILEHVPMFRPDIRCGLKHRRQARAESNRQFSLLRQQQKVNSGTILTNGHQHR